MLNPKLSIMLAHYDEDGSKEPYLKLCLESLKLQTFQNFETIIVSSGKHKPDVADLKTQHYHSEEKIHFPAAIEKAYELTNKDSEYILLLNNDTIMHKDCLMNMAHTFHQGIPGEFILNPGCNSDSKGFLYYAVTGYIKDEKLHHYKYQHRLDEEGCPAFEDIVNGSLLSPFCVFPVQFSPFYCTLMKRSTYDKVGGIDPRYQTNLDDLDMSIRAQKLGIHSMVGTHAFCFHFGGVTSSETKTPEEEKFNTDLFIQKHGFSP